jgi:hypothetical protein
MPDSGMQPGALLEALLELADRAELEVRVISTAGSGAEFRPTESAACRVGSRIWVVLMPDDPPAHQARVLAEALGRFRAGFLEETFIAPGVRNFIENPRGIV